jgi:UDP-2-acetamido-3-amino-2,3-dideoxy-glucuronate N-acetyltransferase
MPRKPTKKETPYYVHPSAIVDDGVEIGAGTKVWHFCHVMGSARIGERCSLGQNVFIAANVRIGTNVKIQNNVSVYEGVTLEDDVFCGPSMVFTNVINPRSHIVRKHEYQPTLVKRGASIGANATIVCGTTIGEYAFVAAGAVVRESVPAHALVAGVPAKPKGWMCSCGVRLDAVKSRLRCPECGQSYELTGEGLVAG